MTQKLLEISQKSFAAYCSRTRCSPDKRLKELLLISKQKLLIVLNGINLQEIPDIDFRNKASRILETNDFFELRSIEFESRRDDYCQKLKQFVPELPIDYGYIKNLSNELGIIKTSRKEYDLVVNLVSAVPIVPVWEMKFKARMVLFKPKKQLLNPLYIRIDELLLSACDSFLHTVVPLALFSSESNETESSEKFMSELYNCFELILGQSRMFKGSSPATSKIKYTILKMVEGALQAVWFHELGHLLQGHLIEPSSHKIEYDADSFAFKILSREEQNMTLDILSILGGLTPFIIMDIIQLVNESVPSDTHPSAKERISHILKIIQVENPLAFKPSLKYLQSVAKVCNPTLSSRLNISLEYSFK